MAISKIPGAGVSADTLEAGDIAANAIGSSEIADDAVGTDQLSNAVAISTSGAIAGTGGLIIDGATVFNEASADVDFRVESNGEANMLVVDASTDRVGIGTATPGERLEIANSGGSGILINAGNSASQVIDRGSTGYDSFLGFQTAGSWDWLVGTGRTSTDTDLDFQAYVSGAWRSTLKLMHSTGRVGIGTSSPSYRFDVQSTTSADETIANFENDINAVGEQVQIRVGHGSLAAYMGQVLMPSDCAYFSSHADPYENNSGIFIQNDGGFVGINDSSPDANLCTESIHVPFTSYRRHSSTSAGVFNGYSNVSSTKNHIFALEADGDVFNETGSYSSGTSDERLKTDIQDTSAKLDKLLALPIKTFYKIHSQPDLKMIGVIAQDLEEVLPNLVETLEVTEETGKAQKDEDGEILLNDDGKPYILDKDGNKLTSYKRTKDSLLIFCAIKAIQELSAKVTALEAA